MDRDNLNEEKNINYPDTVKKKENSPENEILVQFQDECGQNNEFSSNQNKGKAQFVAKDIKNKVEKLEPKKRESNSKENHQNNPVATKNKVEKLEPKKRESNSKENHQNNSVATKNKVEKLEPKKRDSNSKENHENNAVATNYSKNNGKNFGDTKNLSAEGKPNQKKMNPKKSFRRKTANQNVSQTEDKQVVDELSEETFEIEDILNNSEVLELVQDLVNCFTSNSTLPENELQTLKVSLCERTCHVFLNILNSCVTKTYTRVMNTDFLQEFKEKHESKTDACCQTSFSDVTEGVEGTEVQQKVLLDLVGKIF